MMLFFLTCQLAMTVPVFANDFNAPDALDAFDQLSHPQRFRLVPDPADESNIALRIEVPEGEHYGGALTIRLVEHMKDEPTRLYFRYRLRIDHSWTTTHGGKLPGFGGTYSRAGWGGRPSDGRNGWSARGLFAGVDEHNRIPVGSYIYHADMTEQGQTYGNGERWNITLQHDRWYTIEQEIQLDTIGESGGNADGWLRAWVDGKPVFDRKNLHVRDTDELRIETVWFNVYHGGKEPSPTNMHLLIDDIHVAARRPRQSATHDQ